MDEIKERLEIARWFTRDLLGTLSEGERKKLDDWLAASPEHVRDAEIIRGLVENGGLENDRSEVVRRGWKDFQRRTSPKFSRKHFYKYAAIIVFPLVVASCLFFYVTSRQADVLPIAESIQPGGPKAVLILADGKEIQLDQQQGFDLKEKDGTGISVSENQVLQYRAEERAENVAEDKEYYNTLVIPKGGEYKLQLADGTSVWLNAATKFRYPVRFSGDNRTVYLEGEAYFEVFKNKEVPFIVDMGKASLQVLGTSFNARAYKDEAGVFATLTEGKIRLNNGRQSLVLHPEEQGIADIRTGELTKRKVDSRLYSGWKDGRFIFQEQTLDEIMNTLSRWYDIRVTFENEAVRKVTFTGNLKRYDSFDKIIDMLEMTDMAHFKVDGNAIIISK